MLISPLDAKVVKRPLLRPAIPSAHAGASQQKVVYVSTHTPFLSAVKRVEKLLHLADKRLVQSATANAQNQNGRGQKRKRGADGDEILGIAEEVERMKGGKRGKGRGEEEDDVAGEEVVLKGTGKAIHRVLELALWFQQREQEYVVRLRTGSVGAIDDVTVEEGDVVGADGQAGVDGEKEDAVPDAEHEEEDAMELDGGNVVGDANRDESSKTMRKRKGGQKELAADEVPETRIRYTSVLEAAVSLQ